MLLGFKPGSAHPLDFNLRFSHLISFHVAFASPFGNRQPTTPSRLHFCMNLTAAAKSFFMGQWGSPGPPWSVEPLPTFQDLLPTPPTSSRPQALLLSPCPNFSDVRRVVFSLPLSCLPSSLLPQKVFYSRSAITGIWGAKCCSGQRLRRK